MTCKNPAASSGERIHVCLFVPEFSKSACQSLEHSSFQQNLHSHPHYGLVVTLFNAVSLFILFMYSVDCKYSLTSAKNNREGKMHPSRETQKTRDLRGTTCPLSLARATDSVERKLGNLHKLVFWETRCLGRMVFFLTLPPNREGVNISSHQH